MKAEVNFRPAVEQHFNRLTTNLQLLSSFYRGSMMDSRKRMDPMKLFCLLSAIGLVIAFVLLNLFLPLAVVTFAAAVGLGIYCGVIRSPGKKECRFGPC